MDITYSSFDEMPSPEVLDEIIKLHFHVFGESDDLKGRMKGKPKLRIDIALDDTAVVGYKIGYALNREQFYSWLGGVHDGYRSRGIAFALMGNQHKHAKDCGYRTVQTQTKNKWRNMLVLNIKNGFDVIGTFTDSKGEPRIMLEKKL